jgi:CheY-like chemotaxis protein
MNPEIGIIAVTAFSFQQDQEKAIEAGCDLVITKPINILSLKKAIKLRLESTGS